MTILDMNKAREILTFISEHYGYTFKWHGKCYFVKNQTRKTLEIKDINSPKIYVNGILIDRTSEYKFKKDCHRAFSR